MIGHTDEAEATLARALKRHAREAPTATGLALVERVLSIRRVRRRHHMIATAVAVTIASIAIPMGMFFLISGTDTSPPLARRSDAEWRWESYRGIELRVPAAWGYGVRRADWCAGRPEGSSHESRPGAVGRPGVIMAVACPSPYPPLGQREQWVLLDRSGEAGKTELDGGWVAETRRVDSVFVTVFSNDAVLRAEILGSARLATGEDTYGCASVHESTIGRDFRPSTTAGGLPAADEVESVSICRYARSDTATIDDKPILSASRVTGDEATGIMAAIDAAPPGEGPNFPDHCANDQAYGEELIILRVHSSDRTHELLVRYHGCDGHGIDDGATRRKLTTDALRSLLSGPHQPSALSGAVAKLVW